MLRNIKLMLTGGLAITALSFSSVSFSACLENNLLGVTGYESEIVTEYGGSTLTCPTNYVGCSIANVTNDGYCIVPSTGTSNTLLIEIDLATGVNDPLPTLPGAIIWNESEVTTVRNDIVYMGGIYEGGTTIPNESFTDPVTNITYFYLAKFNTNTGFPEQDESGNLIRARGNTDATITDTAQGANGCFNAFGTDQFTAIAGYERENNPGSVFATKAIQFCSDGIKEFTAEAPQPPPVQSRCLIPSTGETAFEKYGVRVTCPEVPVGEQRTIVISKDTEWKDGQLQKVDGYGFFNENKDIDFNNVCVCVGGDEAVIHETACIADPSYEGPNKCTVEEGANVPISVTYQNPFCISGVSTGWCW